jgi:hypothetical protein
MSVGCVVARGRGALRWIALIGYAFVAIGALCLFLRYAFPGGSDREDWALTAWGLLAFGVGLLLAGGVLVLATEGWSRMVGTNPKERKQRGN